MHWTDDGVNDDRPRVYPTVRPRPRRTTAALLAEGVRWLALLFIALLGWVLIEFGPGGVP